MAEGPLAALMLPDLRAFKTYYRYLLRPLLALGALPILAQTAANVLVISNQQSDISRQTATYYMDRRHVPQANACVLSVTPAERITRKQYDDLIAKPVAACLRSKHLEEQILYIVTTKGVPLIVAGRQAPDGDYAAVDSELTLLYSDMRGKAHELKGPIPNPFFGQRDVPFQHPRYPIYLVTRLAAYDWPEIKAMIDRAQVAKNEGKFVMDLESNDEKMGNDWLRNAAILLPGERTVFDESPKVIYGEKDVIAYAGWGSNDKNRKERFLGFRWLPGAIMTEFVSSNGRTFERPHESWRLGTWADPKTWFAGSPQSLTADYLHEGATGGSGHVDEPYLAATPRPDFVLPAYYTGRTLADSFYLGIPWLSWQNIVVGDPLCSIGPPRARH